MFVKVGGGYMRIKDFIEKFTHLEVEKIKRNSYFERLNDKLQIQKISTLKSIESRESSPIREPVNAKS